MIIINSNNGMWQYSNTWNFITLIARLFALRAKLT